MIASTWFDLVLGLDFHVVGIVAPPSPGVPPSVVGAPPSPPLAAPPVVPVIPPVPLTSSSSSPQPDARDALASATNSSGA